MPADCPHMVIVIPLEGPVFLDFNGALRPLLGLARGEGEPGVLTLLEQGVALVIGPLGWLLLCDVVRALAPAILPLRLRL